MFILGLQVPVFLPFVMHIFVIGFGSVYMQHDWRANGTWPTSCLWLYLYGV